MSRASEFLVFPDGRVRHVADIGLIKLADDGSHYQVLLRGRGEDVPPLALTLTDAVQVFGTVTPADPGWRVYDQREGRLDRYRPVIAWGHVFGQVVPVTPVGAARPECTLIPPGAVGQHLAQTLAERDLRELRRAAE